MDTNTQTMNYKTKLQKGPRLFPISYHQVKYTVDKTDEFSRTKRCSNVKCRRYIYSIYIGLPAGKHTFQPWALLSPEAPWRPRAEGRKQPLPRRWTSSQRRRWRISSRCGSQCPPTPMGPVSQWKFWGRFNEKEIRKKKFGKKVGSWTFVWFWWKLI